MDDKQLREFADAGDSEFVEVIANDLRASIEAKDYAPLKRVLGLPPTQRVTIKRSQLKELLSARREKSSAETTAGTAGSDDLGGGI